MLTEMLNLVSTFKKNLAIKRDEKVKKKDWFTVLELPACLGLSGGSCSSAGNSGPPGVDRAEARARVCMQRGDRVGATWVSQGQGVHAVRRGAVPVSRVGTAGQQRAQARRRRRLLLFRFSFVLLCHVRFFF